MAEQIPDEFADLLALTDDDVPSEVSDDDIGPDYVDPDVSEIEDIFADVSVDEPTPEPVVEAPAPVKKTRAKRTTAAEKAAIVAAVSDPTAIIEAAKEAKAEIAAMPSEVDPRDAEIAALRAMIAGMKPVDPRDAEIAELKAQLSQPAPKFSTDDDEDIAKTQERKALQDRVARRNADIAENAPAQLVRAEGAGERILIHFEIDGFMAFGQSWYRGQEIEFVVDGSVYKKTLDRNGDSWVSLAADPYAQIARWNRIYFGLGPFVPRPGEEFTDSLVAEDAKRRRAVPIVNR